MKSSKVNTPNQAVLSNNKSLGKRIYKYRWFYIMFLPVFIMFIIFNYIPMIGIAYSFFEYTPFKDPTFIGLENFQTLFSSKRFWLSFRNTITISLLNLILSMIFSVGLAIMLDDLIGKRFKKISQTILYIPHFLSWVVVASLFTMFLSPQGGVVNNIIEIFGGEPIYFLADEKWWTPVFLLINRWKETGWSTIIFIAALSGVDQEMYEAAKIDGATRIQRIRNITLPAIKGTILVVFILNLAKILNIFEPVLVLYNSQVYNVADVISTWVYRAGLEGGDYGLSTAAGLFKSVISVTLVYITNIWSKKVNGEGVL